MSRDWWGPPADDDQQAVLDLVDGLAETLLARRGDDRPDDVDAARRVLAEHGLWTLGAAEGGGGGGADLTTALMVLARLAGTWPALAWASAQAHAAAAVLAGERGAHADLLRAVHRGDPVAVCVADPVDGEVVELTDDRISGDLVRVDAAGREPRLIVLLGHDQAVVVPRSGVTFGPPLRRTGLDGALTVRCRIAATVGTDEVIRGPQVQQARTLLEVGASALAAGIAEAAAQAALGYSATRTQFGSPLTGLATVRASLSAQAAAARMMLTSSIAAGLDQPDAATAALDPAFDQAIDVAAAAVQSHGGYGYLAEYAVEGLLRDAVSLRAAARANEAARSAARVHVGSGG